MFEQKNLVKSPTPGKVLTQPVLRQERELMALGSDRRWPFRVLGVAPVPTEAIYHNNWWLVPVTQDQSQIPARALERIQAIYEAGIRPKAFVIAHEAPTRLQAPITAPKVSKLEFWSWQMARHSVAAVKLIGTALSAVVVPFVLATVDLGALVALGLVTAVMADPCLIAITEDDVWIQIDFWMA